MTKEQISALMCKHAEKENGLQDQMEIMLESMMVAERGEFLRVQEDRNKENGFCLGHTYGHGRRLEFKIPHDLREVFRTGDKNYTVEMGMQAWKELCGKWGKDYRSIRNMKGNFMYKSYFTYLNYHPRIQSMIYTTNWIERLQKDFRRVTRMRGALPSEESVLLLMGKTAMDKDAYDRALPWMELDKTLFPGE